MKTIKTILIGLFVCATGFSQNQDLDADRIFLRESIRLGGTVTYFYPDTLVNPQFVRDALSEVDVDSVLYSDVSAIADSLRGFDPSQVQSDTSNFALNVENALGSFTVADTLGVGVVSGGDAVFDWNTGLYDYWDFDTYTLIPGTVTGVNSNNLIEEASGNFASEQFTNTPKNSTNSFSTSGGGNARTGVVTTNDWSFSFWFKGNATGSVLSADPYFDYNVAGEQFEFIEFSGTISWEGKTTWSADYNHIALTYTHSTTTLSFYLNGVYLGDFSGAVNNPNIQTSSEGWIYDEFYLVTGRVFDSNEVDLLYNNGDGLFYGEGSPTITLLHPS